MAAPSDAPDWWPSLSRLPGARLRCRMRARTHAPLPNAGEIRGAIGQRLMASGNAAALSCFFPSVRDDQPHGRFGHTTPWALHVAAEGILEIGLFGDAPPHLVALMQALLESSRGRIGPQERLVFEGFEHQPDLVDGPWQPGLPSRVGRWVPPCRPSAPHDLVLLSPLRIRRKGHDLGPEAIEPRDLLSPLMRRATGLLKQAAMPEPDWDPRALLAGIDGLRFPRRKLQSAELVRFSSRQGQAMRLPGLTGRLQLPPELAETFWPLLWMGQALHVGKTPCLGMGRYRLLPAEVD